MNTRFFVDFDGTITKNDVIDMILERFAKPEWKKIEKDWSQGRIGSRECLEKQMRLVQASPADLKKLVSEVELDVTFISFLKKTKKLSVPVIIVSDGLDWVIREVLKNNFQKSPELISEMEIYSNRLDWKKNGVGISFPNGPVCAHACANCKERIMKNLSAADDFVVFVGDGLSDRTAAGAATLTFAKNELLGFCEQNKIKHRRYTNFNDISKWLSSRKASYVTV